MICIVVARSHGYCSDSDDLKPFLQMVVHAVLKGTADCPQPIVASENGLTVKMHPAPSFSQNFVRFLKFLSAIESGLDFWRSIA